MANNFNFKLGAVKDLSEITLRTACSNLASFLQQHPEYFNAFKSVLLQCVDSDAWIKRFVVDRKRLSTEIHEPNEQVLDEFHALLTLLYTGAFTSDIDKRRGTAFEHVVRSRFEARLRPFRTEIRCGCEVYFGVRKVISARPEAATVTTIDFGAVHGRKVLLAEAKVRPTKFTINNLCFLHECKVRLSAMTNEGTVLGICLNPVDRHIIELQELLSSHQLEFDSSSIPIVSIEDWQNHLVGWVS